MSSSAIRVSLSDVWQLHEEESTAYKGYIVAVVLLSIFLALLLGCAIALAISNSHHYTKREREIQGRFGDAQEVSGDDEEEEDEEDEEAEDGDESDEGHGVDEVEEKKTKPLQSAGVAPIVGRLNSPVGLPTNQGRTGIRGGGGLQPTGRDAFD